MDNDNELILKKINYYYKEKKLIHIILKNNRFYNGLIKYVAADFLLLEDRKLGEVCVFFLELKGVEPFTENTK